MPLLKPSVIRPRARLDGSVICFDVSINGERLTGAGLRRGVVSVIVDQLAPGTPSCHVGGMNTARSRNYEYVRWLQRRKLERGDELTVRIVEATRAHRPSQKERSLPREGQRVEGTFAECSFCGKDRPHKLRSGASGGTLGVSTFICRSCACVAQQMKEQKASQALHLKRVQRAQCSFCQQTRQGLIQGMDGRVCSECLRKMVEAM